MAFLRDFRGWVVGVAGAALIALGLSLFNPAGADAEVESGPVAQARQAAGEAGAQEVVSTPPSPRADSSRAALLAGAVTLAERWLDSPPGTVSLRRVRLARLGEGLGGQLIRAIERGEVDPATGVFSVVGSEVMRADAVLVAVPADTTAPSVAGRLRASGFRTGPVFGPDAVVTVLLDEVTVDAVPEAIAGIARVLPDLVAEPDFIRFSMQTTPNDFDATQLWGLEKIEAPAAWTVSTGSAEVIVAVIDSGIETTHPDLAANLWINPGEIAGNGLDDDGNGFIDDVFGWNFAGPNNAVADMDGHGTHVSGTIAAAGGNGMGVVGVTWNTKIMTVRAGSGTFSDSALLNAMRYVLTMKGRGANIVAVNMSLGGEGFSATFRQELINARNAGILVVAAAGNEATNNDSVPLYPASYDVDSVISVASTNHADSLSVFSGYGAVSVDLGAPGTAVLSTARAGSYQRLNGTSMAAPHVAGAIALLAATTPGLDAAAMRARIFETVDPIPALAGKVATGGRLNLRRAVAPSLVPPRVTLTCGGLPAEVAVLDRAGLSLALGAALKPEDGVTPAASLAWSLVEGPAAVTFSSATSADTMATFAAAGRYRVRVVATAGALQESDELVVAVGDANTDTTGLRAWWRFDDTGGSTLDSSGNGRTGSVTAALRSTTAVSGTSMSFDGATSRVAFSAPAFSRVTIAGWARATGNGSSIFPRIVHMREGLLFGGFDPARADDGNSNTLKFALDNGGSDVVWHTPPGSFFTGGWYHVAVAFDPAAATPAPVFYINGARQVTGIQNSVASTPSVPVGTGYLGDRGDGGRAWLGQLDEIRLYDRVLSGAEIIWSAREPTVEALAGGILSAGASSDPLSVPLAFVQAGTALGPVTLLAATWSEASGAASFATTSPGSATATFSGPGTYLVRYDASSQDGVHITRTLPVTVATVPVAREGTYTGTTGDGGIWTMLARSDGVATFFSSSGRGSFQRDVVIQAGGVFNFHDRSGLPVSGRIFDDGTVSGTIGGSTPYSGARAAADSAAATPALDGIYSGWVLDSGTRAAAQIERGRLSVVVEEAGAHRAATGAVETGGAFALAPEAGASFVGSVADGRLDAVVSFTGAAVRRIVLLRDGTSPGRRLINMSVRGRVGTGAAVLIPGFVIEGAGTLPVLVRGVGPGLADYDVPDVLQHPGLVLRQGGTILGQNAGWDLGGDVAEIVAATTLTGAFALKAGVGDTALLLPLGAVPHTVQVRGVDGGSGVALAEVYDARVGTETAEVVNLSGRGFVGTGDDVLVGGFVIAGDAPLLVLVRAAGPALAAFDVEGPLAFPRLTVFRENVVVRASEAWSLDPSASTMAEAAARVGAFAFAPGADDAAQLLFLAPGAYTAQVDGADGGTGVALIEIYRVNGM